MSRYTLHAADGSEIGRAENAQAIGDIAKHRTVSICHDETCHYPFTVYMEVTGGIQGTSFTHANSAFKYCASLPRSFE